MRFAVTNPAPEKCTKATSRIAGAVVTMSLAVMPLASWGAAPVAAQAPTFSTAAVTPENAIAYMNIPLVEDSAQWTLGLELMERAGLADDFNAAREEAMSGLPLDAFLGGEAGVVITDAALLNAVESGVDASGGLLTVTEGTPEAAANGEPAAQGWAVVLDARAPDTVFAGLESAVQSQAEEVGGEVQTFTIDGVDVSYAPPDPADDTGIGMAVAKVGKLSLIAGAPADLTALIATSQGSIPSLADSAPFARVREALPGEFLLYTFVNGTAVRDLSSNLGIIGPAINANVQAGYSGFVLQADQPGLRIESVSVPDATTAVQPAAAVSEFATKTPADALLFLNGIDLGQTRVLDTLGAVLIGLAFGFGDGSDPGAGFPADEEGIARQFEQLAGTLGVNLQTDLLQQLSGEFGLWARAEPDSAYGFQVLFASGLTEVRTVEDALTQLNLVIQGAGSGETAIVTREIGDGSVSQIDMGPDAPPIEYGVVDGELLIGDGDAVDVYTPGVAASLAESEQYRAVMDELPANGSGVFYVDLVQAIPLAQALSETAGETAGSDGDANSACANYETQAEAQAAYDSQETGTFELDQDFDGQACEDFFNAPADSGAAEAVTDELSTVDLSAFQAFATVFHEEGGMQRTSSLLYIGGE